MEIDAQPLPPRGRKFLSPEEWADLKPIIKRLYIDEKRTYRDIALKLKSDFGFEPTKHQFTRKIEEWGLKKNFRKAERELLLRNGNDNDTVPFSTGDKRLNLPRIQRLKKRYAHERQQSQVLPTSNIDAPPIPVLPQQSFLLEEQLKSNNMDEIPPSPLEPQNLMNSEEDTAMDLDPWPLIWDVDVPGSPGLTRLFQLLEIDASIPPIDLNDKVVEEKLFISGTELRRDLECIGTRSKQISPVYNCARHDTVVQCAPLPRIKLPWSPLYELDVFPKPLNIHSRYPRITVASTSGLSIDMWNKEIEKLELKLSKLTKISSGHNSAIIVSLEHLIFIHEELGNVPLGLYYTLLNARLKECSPNGYKIIETYLDIVNGLILQSQFLDAAHLHRSIKQAMQQCQLSSDGMLSIRSSYLEAYILHMNDQYQEAEHIIRLAIQKALRNLGPDHKTTGDAFQLLGWLLEIHGNVSYSEAEKLYRYNIHASRRRYDQYTNSAWFRNIYFLIEVLMDRGEFEESYNLCRYIMEYTEQTVGKKNWRYFRYQYCMGVILCQRGCLSESIIHFRKMLAEEAIKHGKSSTMVINIYYRLAHALAKSGNFREAIVWYKRCLFNYISRYGWYDLREIKLVCSGIGDCYEELLQFEDSLFLYQKLLEKLEIIVADDHPFIKEVQGWVDWVQEKIQKDSASSEEDEIEDDEIEADDCEEDDSREGDIENDEIEEVDDCSREVQMDGTTDGIEYSQGTQYEVQYEVDDVSLEDIFGIEDPKSNEKIVERIVQISSQISSIKL